MPFTLLPAAATSNVDFNVNQSPFYSVYRTESYSTLPDGVIDNRQGTNPVRKLFQVQTGLSATDTEKFSSRLASPSKRKARRDSSARAEGGRWS